MFNRKNKKICAAAMAVMMVTGDMAASTAQIFAENLDISVQKDSGVFDPVTTDMISSGVLTPAGANAAEDGTSATVIGQVVYKYGNNGTNNTIIIEDVEDGEVTGFQLYGKSYVDKVEIGDVVTVTGSISSYGKVKQMSLKEDPVIVKNAAEAGNTIGAQELTIAELLTGGDNYVSEYVKIKDATLGAYDSSNTPISDASEKSINIYKAAAYPDGIAEAAVVNVYGAFSKYNTTYQIRNGNSSDYAVEASGDKVVVDESVTLDFANWTTGLDLGDKTSLVSEKGADVEAAITTYVAGKETAPIITTSSATGKNYYIGSAGLGSAGKEGYYQFSLNPAEKFGKYKIAFSMRGSGTAAKDWTLSYSTDGNTFTDVKTFTIETKSTYFDYDAELPEEANGSDKVFLRLTPGSLSINKNTIGSGGNHYLSGIAISASPVVSDEVCSSVAITPQSGAVFAGQELSFVTATEGASVYYTINGGTETLYNKDAKPVLTAEMIVNGAVVTAVAKMDGKADSVQTVANYTQAQVSAVNALPNGGSIAVGTRVTLTCDTEGAQIQYSSDNGTTWKNYDASEKLVVNTLPASYKVKAVKDGYKDSNEVTLNYTERLNDKYNTYFGQLHAHTSYSDGAGTCEEAFAHASEVANLDFLAITDHSNSFDNADSASITDGSASSEWVEGHELAEKYTTDEFVGIYGYEMTWSNGLGHVNTFNTDGFQSRTQSAYTTYNTALQNYYATLKTVQDSITQFNHPGTTFGDFSDFAYYDEEIDDLITMIEVGNGEGAIGSSGYFPSYEYYQRALDKGWHVAPTNNQDNHKGLWGDANTARSVVLADSLTTENIYDAMRNYRIYATEDNDLNIYYTLDGNVMGSILTEGQTGNKVDISVDLKDATDSSIGEVSVITNGGIVLATETVTTNEKTVDFEIDNNYSYYYIKVVEADGDIAVTAPVWVGEVEAAGINSISTEEVLPVQNEALTVDLDLYNNEASALNIDSIEFSVDGTTVHTADLETAGIQSVASMQTAKYSFAYTYDKVGSMELTATVKATLDGAEKVYSSVLKLTYVKPEMVTKVIIDGTHYNDYVTGYYGGNVGNFTSIAGDKNIKVDVVKDEITTEMLDTCSLLIISAPAKKTGTANAGAYTPAHFSDEFIAMVKEYTDNGGSIIVCGIADYQDATTGQTTTEMNKLLSAIGATTKLNSDEAYDEEKNGGQPYRLYLTNYNADSKYLEGAAEGQEYSAYSGCTVNLNEAAVAAGKAEALVTGFDSTYSIDCKDEAGNSVDGTPAYIEKGSMVALAHETLASGANLFVSGTVFISDFEVKAELDNNWDLPYLNRTIAENIMDEVKVELPVSTIEEVRTNGKLGDVYTIEGYVTAGTNVDGNTFFDAIYVQDDTAGITIFPYSQTGLAIGTKIKITGYVDAYQGDKELQIMSYEILSGEDTKVYDPEKMSAKDAMNYDVNGGKLVKVEGKVVEVITDTEKTGVSQFKLDDGSGVLATVFIDGYILSATTGKNELASSVKVGEQISAVGIVYAHPEGNSDTSVTVLRVRNCDEIQKVQVDSGNGDNGNTDGGNDDNGSSNTGNTDNGNGNTGNTDTGNGNTGNTNTGNTDTGSTDKKNTTSDNKVADNSVKTGDAAHTMIYVYLMMLSVAAVEIVNKKKRKTGEK